MSSASADTLTPADAKRQAIIDHACDLFRDLLGQHIDKAVEDANESFVGDDTQTEPEAKLGFTLTFPTLTRSPEVVLKVAWSARRSDEASAKVNDGQTTLPLPLPGVADAAHGFFRNTQRGLRAGESVTIRHPDSGVAVRIDKDGVKSVGSNEGAA
jgi:hypothetical protein